MPLNPHCVVFCDNPDLVDLETVGPEIENATKIDAVNGGIGTGTGVATVDGQKVAECELVFAIRDA